ncbi:hypothetical protein ACWIGI_16060 [Nocardia sp. NPDC055321]
MGHSLPFGTVEPSEQVTGGHWPPAGIVVPSGQVRVVGQTPSAGCTDPSEQYFGSGLVSGQPVAGFTVPSEQYSIGVPQPPLSKQRSAPPS